MEREDMISYLMIEGYLKSADIISVFKKVPRKNFVLPEFKAEAYEDIPLPILYGQTISAPHMYAIMLELAQVKRGEKVLEIGTGSGYGAALLSKLAGSSTKVYSIEIIPELAEFARKNLAKSIIKNFQVIVGNVNL
ncbi:Protein-L-isoaspartate O-methyltransferase [uncultured archaeon]|nr:Protein-L-isoaspartate O-methyltransferase [uncultured archaeon]